MNKRLLTIAVVPAILITLFIFIKYSIAGGVIDHTVKVINDTDYPAHIVVSFGEWEKNPRLQATTLVSPSGMVETPRLPGEEKFCEIPKG